MIGTGVPCLILLCFVIATSIDSVAASESAIKEDAKAVALTQAAFGTMGGAQAIAGYQDFLAEGALTLSAVANPGSYPITVRSKGSREGPTEVQTLAILNHLDMVGSMLAKVGGRMARPRHSISVIGHNATGAMGPEVDCAIARLDSRPVSLILTLSLRNGVASRLRPTVLGPRKSASPLTFPVPSCLKTD